MPPILLEPAEPRRVSRSRYRRWTWRRQLKASGLRLTLLALLAGALWGAWYLANKGFGRQWRLTVVEELRKRGVEASVRRLTLDPFRGLVAQDLRIYDFENRDAPLAVISEVSLDINYAALLHRQPFLNALDIRDANVTFPNRGGDRNAPRARLTQFRAHVYFPPDQIYISQAEGIFCGVRISATGQLIKRADYKPARPMSEEEWRQRMQLLQAVATELARFEFAGGPPSLQVKFSGDVAQMEKAHVQATFRGERVRRAGYEIKTVAVAGEWLDLNLELTQCEWSDATGSFSGRASWNAGTKQADFQAHSSVNPKALLDAFGFETVLEDVTLAAPPVLELSGTAKFSEAAPQLNVFGEVELGQFAYRNVPLLSLSAAFSWNGTQTMLRDVRVRHQTGEILADLLDAPGDFRLNVDSTANPAAFRALAPEGVRRFLAEWEWPRSPSLRMAIRGPARDPAAWSGEGAVGLQRTRFRGVWMNRATADVRLTPGAITFRDLHVARDEGTGSAESFTYDFRRHEVRLAGVRTHLRPSDVIYWIEPKFAKELAPYRFRGVPDLTADGTVHVKRGKTTRLEIGVSAPDGMHYDFLGKTLELGRVDGRLLFTDDRLQLIKAEGAVFGGTVKLDADISLARGDSEYSASVAAEGIDFPKLTKLYFDFDTARGQLSGTYDFKANARDKRSMEGSGKLRVANGNVFAIPVFGPLSGLMSSIIPGSGHSVAREATASFTVRNGVIHTMDFRVSGRTFGLVGHGDLHFVDDRLDFDIRVDPKGPTAVLTPVYELFEYKGDGPLSKPNWHPKRF